MVDSVHIWYKNVQFPVLSLAILLVAGCRPEIERPDPEPPVETVSEFSLSPVEPVHRDFSEIRRSGVLRMITRYSSGTYFLHQGREAGFEYELLRAFAKEHDLSLEVIIAGRGENPWDLLNSGEGDVIAANLVVTPEREENTLLTVPYKLVDQVVVYSTDRGNPPRTLEELSGSGLTLTVEQNSIYYRTLKRLKEDGYDLDIRTPQEDLDTEALLYAVTQGSVEATVVHQSMFSAASRYMQGLKPGPRLTSGEPVAWAVRRNAPDLQTEMNRYLSGHFRFDGEDHRPRRSEFLNVLRHRYFETSSHIAGYFNPDWAFQSPEWISPYDQLIREVADSLELDWLMLTAMIAQESGFEPASKSWAGAVGLMQIIPRFSEVEYQDLYDPEINIREGARIIRNHLDHYAYMDSLNQWSFALATYNVGKGHIADARRLAIDQNKDPNVWENIADALLKLMQSPYHENARYGYARGIETVNYVEEVLNRYRTYDRVVAIAELRGGTRMPAMEALNLN